MLRARLNIGCIISVFLLALVSTAVGKTIYVDCNATGCLPSCGDSWETACKYLQDGLAQAEPGDQIWMAEGIYKPDEDCGNPTGTGDRNATFTLKNLVAIYGGFAGGETSLDQRTTGHPTILSGDLQGNDDPGTATAGLLSDPCRADNSFHVVSCSLCGPPTILDMLTISGGNANGTGDDTNGGGMYISENGSPTITGCQFTRNSASNAAAAMLVRDSFSDPALSDCLFTQNLANYAGGIGTWLNCRPTLDNCSFSENIANNNGGAMHNDQAAPVVNSSIFTNNQAVNGGAIHNYETVLKVNDSNFIDNSATYGGAVYSQNNSDVTLTGCRFTSNSATTNGGAIYDYASPTLNITDCNFITNEATAGGGIYTSLTRFVLTGSLFYNNVAQSVGGAVYNYRSPSPGAKIVSCFFCGNTAETYGGAIVNRAYCYRNSAYHCYAELVNCLLTGNKTNALGSYGGAQANLHHSDWTTARTYVESTNCTYAQNTVQNVGGGIYNSSYAYQTIANCILWYNRDEGVSVQDESAQLHGPNYTVNYSCIQGWTGSLGGLGNTDEDPSFVFHLGPDYLPGTPDDNLRLLPGSCAIDEGDNTAVPAGITTDLDGNPRFVDDPYTIDSGIPTPSEPNVVDMGAYEFPHPNKPNEPPPPPTGRTIYVDCNAIGPVHDGTSWCQAYKYLLDALAAASAGDEIWVAKGTYKPDEDSGNLTGTGDRNATFTLKNLVSIYGSFAGCGEPDPNARDIELYKTILSGDLLGNDDPGTATADLLSDPCRADNSFHVVSCSLCGPPTILDMLTISGGNANGTGDDHNGGGMYISQNGSPTINDCHFTRNSASNSAAAMLVRDSFSDPTLSRCQFTQNLANYAGGIGTWLNCLPTLKNCSFSENIANYNGGAMLNSQAAPVVNSCTFTNNRAVNGGAGAIHNKVESVLEVTDSNFVSNSATNGGAVYSEGNSSVTVTTCRFTSNRATTYGGAIYDYASPILNITDCNFITNEAAAGGGLYTEATRFVLTGSLLCYNVAQSVGGAVYNYRSPSPGALIVGCMFCGNTAETYGGAIVNRAYCYRNSAYHCYAELVNCVLTGNKTNALGSYGGAQANLHHSDWTTAKTYVKSTNCTYAQNTVQNVGGGIYNNSYAYQTIANCILYLNTDTGGSVQDESAQLHGPNYKVNHSCIQGWTGTIDPAGVGNCSEDPKFVDPRGPDYLPGTCDDNLRVLLGSCAIDDGNSALVPLDTADVDGDGKTTELLPLDFDAHPRIVDADGNDTVTVDMGAYEVFDPSLECMKDTAAEYADWAAYGKPECWCFHKQCRGDADGLSAFGSFVALSDLNILKAGFGKTVTELFSMSDGFCGDFDHMTAFGRPVALSDLNILKLYFGMPDASVPFCDQIPINTGPYNFWTSP